MAAIHHGDHGALAGRASTPWSPIHSVNVTEKSTGRSQSRRGVKSLEGKDYILYNSDSLDSQEIQKIKMI